MAGPTIHSMAEEAPPFSQAPLHGGFADAQMRGRPTDRAEALDGGSHGLDLMAAHGSLQRLVRWRMGSVLDKEIARQGLEPDLVLACSDGETLNDVAQLSNVARPGIMQKTIHHRSREAAREAVAVVDLLQETVSQGDDVLRPLPERGNKDWDDAQAIEEILAKCSLAYHGPQVAVGRSDQPEVHLDHAGAAEAGEGPVLEHLQELDLQRCRHLADLVKEQ